MIFTLYKQKQKSIYLMLWLLYVFAGPDIAAGLIYKLVSQSVSQLVSYLVTSVHKSKIEEAITTWARRLVFTNSALLAELVSKLQCLWLDI